jgi:hypothetical protein
VSWFTVAVSAPNRLSIPFVMLSVVLVALTSISITLMLLSWLGRLRANLQGESLALAFRSELLRRGLIDGPVLRA